MGNKYKLYSQLLDKNTEKKPKKKVAKTTTPLPLTSPSLPQVIPLREKYSYTCHICQLPIMFDTLFYEDFLKRYIPLNEDMTTHKCNWKLVKKKK